MASYLEGGVVRPHLHAVSCEGDGIWPVNMERLHHALAQLPADVLSETSVMVDGVPFQISLDPQSRYFSLRTTWHPSLPIDAARPALFALADSWNRERFFPTLYLVDDDDGSVRVVVDYIIDCNDGLTNDQLIDALKVGFEVGPDAVFYMQDSAQSVLGITDPTLPE